MSCLSQLGLVEISFLGLIAYHLPGEEMARHLPETMQPLHVWRQEQQHIPMDASSLAPLLQIFLRHLLGLILQFS